MSVLREKRKRLKLTQQDVADKAGIGRAAYGHIEVGRKLPSISVGISIARTLKSTVEELFGDVSLPSSDD